MVFGRQQHRLESTPERGTTCAPSVRRTATIIAVAAGLLPQLPAWHPPLTVASPTLQRSRSGSATARAVTDRIVDERRRRVAELMRKAGEVHRVSRKRINLVPELPSSDLLRSSTYSAPAGRAVQQPGADCAMRLVRGHGDRRAQSAETTEAPSYKPRSRCSYDTRRRSRDRLDSTAPPMGCCRRRPCSVRGVPGSRSRSRADA